MEKLKKNKIKFKKEDLKEGALNLGNILLSSIAIIGLVGVAITAPNAIKLLECVLPDDEMKRHYS